jgi:DNA-binding NtrC family response regulator
VIAVVETRQPNQILDLLRQGAADFVLPPLQAADILPRVWRLLEQMRPAEKLTLTLKERLGLKQLIGESPVFVAERDKIPLVAKCDANVLLAGETGTGKELCARAIHYLSQRSNQPFIPVNCGAIPLELAESELFGHRRGAFTGATASQLGLIHEAEGGTLFLDEIDCLPLATQVKLLRFLQDKEYRPLGSPRVLKADVRIIAATNSDLEAAVKDGKFRRDLYYRLNMIPLKLPPLRERREDIPLLVGHFLEKHASECHRQVARVSAETMRRLVLYDWPGNVRELEYIIARMVILSDQRTGQVGDISLPASETASCQESFQQAKAKTIEEFERLYIERLLLAQRGNITRAAQAAQKNRRAFWQLIRKHGIDVQRFKTSA